MFDEICSIYRDAYDNVGQYVDQDTGECIVQMTIRDFCLTDRWKTQVERLRYLRAEFGDKAKKMQEYVDTKKQLPCASLSGLYDIYDDVCTRKDGTTYIAPVRKRETHLIQHTGWLAIDIDLADNLHLSDFNMVKDTLSKFHPEVAMLMRSCSGAGYFGLVRLAYPDKHRLQFKALDRWYNELGIKLDKQCINVGRLRFASWEDSNDIYINENAIEYTDVFEETPPLIPLKNNTYNNSAHTNVRTSDGFWLDPIHINRLVELVCHYLISHNKDITSGYDNWMKLALSLQSHPYGERFFHELSQCNPDYNAGITAQKWRNVGTAKTVTYAYLLHQARQYIDETIYRDLKRQVWQEYHNPS